MKDLQHWKVAISITLNTLEKSVLDVICLIGEFTRQIRLNFRMSKIVSDFLAQPRIYCWLNDERRGSVPLLLR